MINHILFLMLILVSFFANAELNCSSKGMDVLHIPGFSISKLNQDKADLDLKNILILKPNYFDNKSQNSTLIPISTQGYIQDKLSYLMMEYGDRYGSKAEEAAWMTFGITEYGYSVHSDLVTLGTSIKYVAKTKIIHKGLKSTSHVISNYSEYKSMYPALFNISGQSVTIATNNGEKSLLQNLTDQSESTRVEKIASMFLGPSLLSFVNLATIRLIEGNWGSALDQQRDTILATKWTINDNIDKVKNAISKKLNDNKKVIINAHAEGNQLASRAIAQLKLDPNYTNRVNKYVSILATSPTSNAYHGKYVYMKNDHDNRLLDITTPYNFILIPNFSVFDVSAGMSYNSHSTDNFLDFYISPINKAKRVNTIEKVAIRDLYIQDLRKSAELLESNCGDPILQLTSIDTNVIITNSPESNVYWKTDVPLSGKILNLKVSDHNIYPFPVTTTYKWELYKGENLIQTGTDNQFSIQIDSIPEPQSPWQGLYNLSDVSHPYGEIEVKNISYTLKLTSTNNLGINGYIETPVNIDVTKQCKFTKFTFGETLDGFGNVGTNSVILKCGAIPCYKLGLTIGLASSFSGYDYVFTSLDDTERMLVSDIRDGSGEKVINAQICQNSNSDGDISISRTNSNDQLRIWNP